MENPNREKGKIEKTTSLKEISKMRILVNHILALSTLQVADR